MEKYYYLDSANNQCGPVDASQLPQCGVTAQTYVWREGMPEWKRAGELPELAAMFAGAAPATPGAQPQYAPGSSPLGTMVPPSNNLVWAILVTILCCMPTGIYAIICAAKVDTLWFAGRYEEARMMSRRAATWSWISAGAAILVWLLYLGFWGAMAATMLSDFSKFQ